MSSLQLLVKQFFSPDSAELGLGPLKLKYTDAMRNDISLVLGTLRGRRVLFAEMDHELWMYVFPSLNEIRRLLSDLSGKIQSKATDDVNLAVNFMLQCVVRYTATHEADYHRFMADPRLASLNPAHRERNWPNLGGAAADLLALRQLLHHAIQQLNLYADRGEVVEWELPAYSAAAHWENYAAGRKLCPVCGWNMYFAYDEDCPVCPNAKTLFSLRPNGSAKAIHVAGTFNQWAWLPLKQSDYTTWKVRVLLPPGAYEYKFIVDGEWIVDPANPEARTDSSGNRNSVLLVRGPGGS